MPHLLADISGHGFGHLAQAAPVLNALAGARPDLRISIRSSLARERLGSRIAFSFDHLHTASDFGFVMKDALQVDVAASARRYREFHADWPARVEEEAVWLHRAGVDAVFTDVAYLPLAGACRAGLPSISMCSLNWADLFAHFFAAEPWGGAIHAQILAAYRCADRFLRTEPGMPMRELGNVAAIGPVAELPRLTRDEAAHALGLPMAARWVLIALGGFDHPLPVADWPRRKDVLWLTPDLPGLTGLPLVELLAHVDAVITKPGYGTFVEAAVNGVPVLYLRRHDWPEQACLLDWLAAHGRSMALSGPAAASGAVLPLLDELWRQPAPVRPRPTGVGEAVAALVDLLP